MSGPFQTRAFLLFVVLLCYLWEMYVGWRFGQRSTISHVLGDIFRIDPAFLVILVVLLMHCVYLGVRNEP